MPAKENSINKKHKDNNGELKEPKKSLNFYFDYIICKLKFFFSKYFR